MVLLTRQHGAHCKAGSDPAGIARSIAPRTVSYVLNARLALEQATKRRVGVLILPKIEYCLGLRWE
jgi:hypothetical protein